MESSNSNSKERELQLTQRLAKQRHSICMTWFEQLETHLHDLYLLNSPYAVDAFKPAFREEHQTFKFKIFHNLDQLRLQLERENLHGVNAKTCLQALSSRNFLPQKRVVNTYGVLRMKQNEVNALKENRSKFHDEILHEHQIKSSVKMQSQDIKINPVQAMDDSLIVSKSSLIEPENNNAFSKSEIETQTQRLRGKVCLKKRRVYALVRLSFKETYSRSIGLQSQGIQGQAAQSGYEYAILDSKGHTMAEENILAPEPTRLLFFNRSIFFNRPSTKIVKFVCRERMVGSQQKTKKTQSALSGPAQPPSKDDRPKFKETTGSDASALHTTSSSLPNWMQITDTRDDV
ncbi:hypothetical protein Tco_1378804 [Tanacetum coccineum]